MCPDFAAEHADISTGGIGAFGDWTLTIVRTDLGRDLIMRMLEDGTIEGRPGDDDPGAIELLRRLSAQPAQAVAGGGGRRPPPAPARSRPRRRRRPRPRRPSEGRRRRPPAKASATPDG